MKIKPVIIYLSAACLAFMSCKNNSGDGLLLVTRMPAGNTSRYVAGSQIVSIDPGHHAKAEILTSNLHSACYPEVSYDGRFIIFSGQEKENDPWQLFEMDLRKGITRKITSYGTDCLDPVYLPAGRMAFSMYIENDTVKSARCIFTGSLNGSDVRQVTFGPGSNLATTVLKDGRLLTVLSGKAGQMLSVMRPDGTKADMFYKGRNRTELVSRARQTEDGRILFAENTAGNPSENDIISITYNRPLHSKINLTEETPGDFNSVLPMKNGNILVSYKKPGSDRYALYNFDPLTGKPESLLYEEEGYSIVEAVMAQEYIRPKKLPSEVDPGVKTGLLLCQDINFTGFETGNGKPATRAAMVEIIGIDSSYGIIPAESDGSIYLKILADTPFQIRTLDIEGNVINGPCTWLWLRPNERRGCVGCHEDPETVPHNRIPEAVKKDPFIIPVHVTKIREKTVELE